MSVFDSDQWRQFTAQVRAAPEDDTVRLAAADWLEEHGERGRAELIRLTMTLDFSDRRTRRFRRVWELLATVPLPGGRYFATYLPAVLPSECLVDGVEVAGVLDRGFVARVVATAAGWLAHGDAVLAREPVARVTLTTWPEVHVSSFGLMIDGDRATQILPWENVRDHPGGQVAGALAARWPGVKFDLPPEPGPFDGMRALGERMARERDEAFLRAITGEADNAGVTFRLDQPADGRREGGGDGRD